MAKQTDIVPVIQREVSPLTFKAHSIVVIDEATMVEASTLLTGLNKFNDRITTEKESITKPLNQALKVERARWKPMEDLLDGAITAVRTQMSTYQTLKIKAADEEAARIAGRVGEGRGYLKAETAMKKIDEIEKPVTTVATENGGTVKFKTVKKFEVISLAKLATYHLEYILPDEVAIRKAMHAGTELAGVRYYTEQQAENSR